MTVASPQRDDVESLQPLYDDFSNHPEFKLRTEK